MRGAIRSDFKLRRLFTTKNGRELMESEEVCVPPQCVFGHLWHEGETAVMFGERSVGKSVLAVQIADAITRGESIIEPREEHPSEQRVLYVDLSLNQKQFNLRYAEDFSPFQDGTTNRHKFSERFHRSELDPLAEMPDDFKRIEEYILARIEDELETTKARVLIIDNIDRFNGEIMRTRDLAFVMSRIRKLKAAYGLSVLILAELPHRLRRQPLSPDRLMATRLLSNFADTVFGIGRCRWDETYRYIRHFRSGASEVLCDETHVPTFRIVKEDENFLVFQFEFYKPESHHLEIRGGKEHLVRVDRVKELAEAKISQRRIADFMLMSLGSVNRALQMWSPWEEKRVKASASVIEKLERLEELRTGRSPTKIAQNVEHSAEKNDTVQDHDHALGP